MQAEFLEILFKYYFKINVNKNTRKRVINLWHRAYACTFDNFFTSVDADCYGASGSAYVSTEDIIGGTEPLEHL